MYKLIATIVVLIGSSVATEVWFARKREKRFVEQMDAALAAKNKKPVKEADVIHEPSSSR